MFDLSQLLLRDFKDYTMSTIQVGVSDLVIDAEQVIQKGLGLDGLETTMQAFKNSQGLDILFLITHGNGPRLFFKTDDVLFSNEPFVQMLIGELELLEVNGCSGLRVFSSLVGFSRKVLEPILIELIAKQFLLNSK